MYPLNWPFSMYFARIGVPLFIRVEVRYDKEAEVYVATSPNLKGLIVEAPSLDDIKKEVELCVPELIEVNHFNMKAICPHPTSYLRFNTCSELAI